MNIILLHLVEYLGHSNPFVCAVAYAEVRTCWLLPYRYVLVSTTCPIMRIPALG